MNVDGGLAVLLVHRTYSQEEWSEIVFPMSGVSLMQTWEYGEGKAKSGWWTPWRAVFVDSGVTVAAVQGLYKRFPVVGGGLLWINRGPLKKACGPPTAELIVRLVREPSLRGVYIRIAPPVCQAEVPMSTLSIAGIRETPQDGWCSSVLDLEPSVDTLRSNLMPKWRNCLNKAQRSPLVVSHENDEAVFETYLEGLDRFIRDRAFKTTLTPGFLRSLQQLLPNDRKLLVFNALLGGKIVASILVGRYGHTCEYLSGTASMEGRNFNAGHLLLWKGIEFVKELGYRRFDLGGMHPNRTPKGIYHFKEGLRGNAYCFAREVESASGTWRDRVVRWVIDNSRRDPSSIG